MMLEYKDFPLVASGLITATSTLFAVAITSGFNLWQTKLNLKTQNRQKEAERELLKIEEIYLLFLKWETNFSNIYLLHLRCLKGKLDYRDLLLQVKEMNMLLFGEFQKLQMLMNVHFPILANQYDVVNNARAKIAPFLNDPKDIKQPISEFIAAQENFEAVCEDFKMKICNLTKK
jgi:hypothetical protein